jgi:hypothetical protein
MQKPLSTWRSAGFASLSRKRLSKKNLAIPTFALVGTITRAERSGGRVGSWELVFRFCMRHRAALRVEGKMAL